LNFGAYIKSLREAKRAEDPAFSLRRVAERADIDYSYLSKLENGVWTEPSEKVVLALADVLNADPDLLLAMTGRVSKTFQEALMRRPDLFKEFLRLAREVRDGEW